MNLDTPEDRVKAFRLRQEGFTPGNADDIASDESAGPPPPPAQDNSAQLAALDALSAPPAPVAEPDESFAATPAAPPPEMAAAMGAGIEGPPPVPAPATAPAPLIQANGQSPTSPADLAAEQTKKDHLAALQAIASGGDEEESNIRAAAARDRDRADTRQMREYISAGFRRQPAQTLPGGPTDLDTEKAISASRDKRQALLAKASEEKPVDPALQAYRIAQAGHYGALSEIEKSDAVRKKTHGDARLALDTKLGNAKLDEVATKDQSAKDAKDAEAQEAKAGIAAIRAKVDPKILEKIDPQILDNVKTLKGVDRVREALGMGPTGGKLGGKSGKSPGSGIGSEFEKIKEGDLSTVPPDIRATVDMLSRGNGKVPDASSKSGRRTLEALNRFKPGTDTSKFEAYQSLRKELTSGADAPKIQALNVAIGHLADLEDVLPSTSDSQTWNKIASSGLQAMGSTKYERFNATRMALVDELTKAYGIVNQHAAEALEKQLGEAKSKEQLQSVIKQYRHLLHSPIEAYQFRWDQAAPAGTPYEFLTPKAKAAMARDAAEPLGGSAPTAKAGGGGKLTVKKGNEVLEIDPADAADAKADGYEVVQ